MQDKIQEIMFLVDALSVECIAFGIAKMASSAENKAILGDDVKKSRALLQSKLRELVREPLSDDDVDNFYENSESLHGDYGGFFAGFRCAERAHNITNTSGVE